MIGIKFLWIWQHGNIGLDLELGLPKLKIIQLYESGAESGPGVIPTLAEVISGELHVDRRVRCNRSLVRTEDKDDVRVTLRA